MTDYGRNENVQVILGRESAFGVGDTGTPAGHKLVLAAVSGGRTVEWGDSPILRGDPFQADPIYGMQRASLTLRSALTIGTLPLILKLFGKTAVSGTGDPYTHTFKGSISDTEVNSGWIERWNADRARGDRFFGCRAAGLRVSVGNKGPQPLLLEVPIVASGDPSASNRSQSARYDATPDTYDTQAVQCLKDATAKVGGSTTTLIEQLDLSIMLAQTPVDILDGTDVSAEVVPAGYVVSGKLTGLFDQADTIRGYASATTPQAIVLLCPNPSDTTHPITFTVPRAFCNVTADPDHQGQGLVRASVDFKGAYDSTNTSSWVITVLNAVSTYTNW